MSKSTLPFNPAEYAPVADRISAFYAQYPTGRIITKLVSRDRDVVFRAAVYRSADERAPAATGWASEREGNGEINMYACLENTETSAIGRALANLGFTASLKRPSREEMQKAERARGMRGSQLSRVAESPQYHPYRATAPSHPALKHIGLRSGTTVEEPLRLANEDPALVELLELVDDLQLRGFPAKRLAVIRAWLDRPSPAHERVTSLESALRSWLARHTGLATVTSHPPDDALVVRDDLEQTLREAEATGFPPERASSIRETMSTFPPSDMVRIAALEAQLRRWIDDHRP